MDNVLGSTPVRQACILPSVEWQNVKDYIQATALIHPSISFSVRDHFKAVEILQIQRAATTQERFRNFYPWVTQDSTMKKLVFEKADIKMKAISSSKLCQYKKIQFVFVNKRYISNSNIQKYFKTLLYKCFRDLKMKEALEVKSRWQPIFVLNITCPKNKCNIHFELNRRVVEFKNFSMIKYCLIKLSNQFRKMHGLDSISSPYLGLSNENGTNHETTLTAKKLFEELNDANTLFGFPITRGVSNQYSNERRKLTKIDRENEKPFQTDFIEEFSPVLSAAAYSQKEPILNSREDENKDNSSANIGNISRVPVILKENEDDRLTSKPKIVSVHETMDQRSNNFERNKENYDSPLSDRNESYQMHGGTTVFDILHNQAFQGETVSKVPLLKAFPDVNNHEIEDDNVENNVISVPADHLLTKCSIDFDMGKINKQERTTQFSQKRKKVILREPRLKFDNFLVFEFGVKPTNDTFVNYFKKKNSNDISLPKNIGRENNLEENSSNTPNAKCSQYDKNSNECKMNLNDGAHELCARSTEMNGSHDFNYSNRHIMTPKCCCSCHQVGTYSNINDQYSRPDHRDVRRTFCSEVESNMCSLKTPTLNVTSGSTRMTSTEETFLRDDFSDMKARLKSDTQNFSVTPSLVSPYFFVPESFREERKDAEENNLVPIMRTNFKEIAAREQTEEKYRVDDDTCLENENLRQKSFMFDSIENLTLKSLKRKMKYKKNCKLLSSAGVVDVPMGMLKASHPKGRRTTNFLKDGRKDLRTIVRPYTLKNHYSVDDEGFSCLRLFPHLQTDTQSTANCLNMSTELNCHFPFTKSDLNSLRFLAQIDEKYLLASLNRTDTEEKIVVIFDQHALDERIRVERLFTDYTDETGTWKSIAINPPIYLVVNSSDLSILREFRASFQKMGLYFELNEFNMRTAEQIIAVVKIPTCLHCKSMREFTASNSSLKLKELVESLIKEIMESLENPQCPVQSNVPDTLHKMLNYEACRGAIKFGDQLSEKVCISLLKKISGCDQPFQCAHGRPSMIPLINLSKIGMNSTESISKTDNSTKRFERLLDLQLKRVQ